MEAISVKNLSVAYENNTIIEDLSLSIPKGKISIIIGANGCGKSTFLKTLARINKPKAGEIFINKKDIKNILSFCLGAFLTSIFVYLDYKLGKDGHSQELVTVITTSYALKLFACGGVAAGAMIIPGISGSLLLLMLGEYYNILGFINKFFSNLIHIMSYSSLWEIITNLYIIPLTAFSLGMLIGLVLISKLINILLQKHRSITLFFITGIIVVSILQIWLSLY